MNAMTLDIAMGGSTNTVLHLLAVAHEAGADFKMCIRDRLCPAFGAGKHIVVMLGFGADAWNANEAEQVFQHFSLVLGDVFLYFHG